MDAIAPVPLAVPDAPPAPNPGERWSFPPPPPLAVRPTEFRKKLDGEPFDPFAADVFAAPAPPAPTDTLKTWPGVTE